jgi:hypothetical protein
MSYPTAFFPIMQTLVNRSRIKSDKLRPMEDGACQLQEKDRRIGEEIMKNIELQNELNTLKQERTREVWLSKKDIENLTNKNKAMAKTHRGYNLLIAFALHCFIHLLVSELVRVLSFVDYPQNSII